MESSFDRTWRRISVLFWSFIAIALTVLSILVYRIGENPITPIAVFFASYFAGTLLVKGLWAITDPIVNAMDKLRAFLFKSKGNIDR